MPTLEVFLGAIKPHGDVLKDLHYGVKVRVRGRRPCVGGLS